MPKLRRPAPPAPPDPLPSLEELWAAHERGRAECRETHMHSTAELAECERRHALDPRVAEFRRRVAFFFDKLRPGETLPMLPDGDYQAELDRIAESLGVRTPEASSYSPATFGVVKPAGIPLALPFAQAQKLRELAAAGRPVPHERIDLITGERTIIEQPICDRPVARAAGKGGRRRRISDPEWAAHLADVPLDRSLSPGARARMLSATLRRSISRGAVRTRLEQ